MKSSQDSKFCISLSLGSTHISLVVARPQKERIQILGAERLSHYGAVHKGVVLSIEALTAAILEALDEVERQSGLNVKTARVCIGSGSARFDNYIETSEIPHDEILETDIQRFNANTIKQRPSDGFHFVHQIPGFYHIDGKFGIRNPVGMKGKHISRVYHRVCLPEVDLQNVIRACRRARVQVEGVVFEPLAAAEGVLNRDEKEFGCVSLSIGAYFTHVAVYFGGTPIYSREYPVGSYHITKDIAIVLNTTQVEAERMKKEYGEARVQQNDTKGKIEVQNMNREGTQTLERYKLIEVIESRVFEILETVYFDLKRVKLLSKIPNGVVLSGGGSLLNGLTGAAEKIFEMHARIGRPRNIFGSIEGLGSPIWASAFGTLSPLFKPAYPIDDKVFMLQLDEISRFESFATKIWRRLKEPFVSQ